LAQLSFEPDAGAGAVHTINARATLEAWHEGGTSMGLHKGMDKYIGVPSVAPRDPESWQFAWPNTADHNFNYYKLLDSAEQSAIAQNQNPDLRVAIVGAGIAGLTAARELFRCGYTNIDIYEASGRIGGRNYSIPAPDRLTTYEMGAMRMPFFTQPGAQNCVLDYYRNLFGITTQPFPDAGSAATASTGIYINDGELVYMPAITQYDPNKPGFFGGLGMSEQEAWDFYVIGAGDGGWGAFYDISCLYPIRTLLFGFSTNHQLIQGTFDASVSFAPDPEQGKEVADSLGHPLTPPHYLGGQTFSECLFYQPVASSFVEPVSLYQATKMEQYNVNLFTHNGVHRVRRLDSHEIELSSHARSGIYDAVIVTPSTWAFEMSATFENFDRTQLPYEVLLSLKESHWITSCKVYFPLKGRYWEQSSIPQVINTDTFLQDIYGIAVTTATRSDPGVILVSYTWEDDAMKLEASRDDATLAHKCLAELDRILVRCENIGRPISPYVDTSKPPVVIHWERQPSYRGCAKLYRERSWNLDYALLTYNQQCSKASGLYFAGEAYSIEGGWTEPALRSGLDAVLRVIYHTGGTFLNGFAFETDYPTYDTQWAPTSPSSTPAPLS
jgi:monoamine oxidase